MRSLSLVSVLLVLTLGACDATAPTASRSDLDVRASRSGDRHMVPFTTTGYFFQVTGSAPDAGCNAPGERRVSLTGGGNATHLGRFTVVFSFCSRPDGTLADGRGTFVSANGDLLHFTFHGISSFVPPGTVNFTSFTTFTGGTGRFEDVSGEAVVTGTVDRRTGSGTGRWDGSISSVGSSER